MDLGLSFGYHDSSAAIVLDSREIFSSHEERFSRIKFDKSFPEHVLHWLSEISNFEKIDTVNYYENPNLKTIRKLSTLFMRFPHSLGLTSKVFSNRLETNFQLNKLINSNLKSIIPNYHVKKINFFRHHETHAACSFFLSPFEKAIILVNDAVGEFDTSSTWVANKSFDQKVKFLEKKSSLKFPDSLGLFYSMMTLYCGFKVNTGEYKLMGLAPYGNPVYKKLLLENVINIKNDGYVTLNRDYLSFLTEDSMLSPKLEILLKNTSRNPESNLTQFHADVAKSVQVILEDALVQQTIFAQQKYGKLPICFSGGVALNAVGNMKICEIIGEENFFAPPASGDAGGALGAAILGNLKKLTVNKFSSISQMKKGLFTYDLKGAKIGRQFSHQEILNELKKQNVLFTFHEIEDCISIVAKILNEGKTVGWFFGPSEWGPRSLGARSILADPRTKFGQIEINKRIKFRESFRPFAPIVLQESMKKYFVIQHPSPFMLRTVLVKDFSKFENQEENSYSTDIKSSEYLRQPISIRDRIGEVSSVIPAVTHLDGTARVQTIGSTDFSYIYDLLKRFELLTGCGVLINTSFNVRGEPIVDSPKDALDCFLSTGLDALCIEGFIVIKNDNLDKIRIRNIAED